MNELVFLVIPLGERDEDATVVDARDYTDGGACEFCGDLIVASCVNAPFGTVIPVGRDRGVVRRLFGEEGYPNRFLSGGVVGALDRIDGRLGRSFGRVSYRGGGGVDFPVALKMRNARSDVILLLKGIRAYGKGRHQRTLKNSPRVELYGLHGFPLTYFCNRVSALFSGSEGLHIPDLL